MMPRLLRFTTMMIRRVRFLPKTAPHTATPRFGTLENERVVDPIREESFPVDQVRLLCPIVPTKVVGIGLNYKDHALEQGKPLPEVPYVFLKATNALCGPGDTIQLNRHCTLVHHEAELMVVIGKTCKNVTEAEALSYVAGYTIANDVTDRPIQKEEATFARAKGMDTFCPVGPYIVSGIDWRNKTVKAWVNGELRQSGNTNDMIHPVPKLISFISQFMTLNQGDAILTGTPAGVGPIKSGDRVKIEIEDLGVLENAVEQQA